MYDAPNDEIVQFGIEGDLLTSRKRLGFVAVLLRAPERATYPTWAVGFYLASYTSMLADPYGIVDVQALSLTSTLPCVRASILRHAASNLRIYVPFSFFEEAVPSASSSFLACLLAYVALLLFNFIMLILKRAQQPPSSLQARPSKRDGNNRCNCWVSISVSRLRLFLPDGAGIDMEAVFIFPPAGEYILFGILGLILFVPVSFGALVWWRIHRVVALPLR